MIELGFEPRLRSNKPMHWQQDKGLKTFADESKTNLDMGNGQMSKYFTSSNLVSVLCTYVMLLVAHDAVINFC